MPDNSGMSLLPPSPPGPPCVPHASSVLVGLGGVRARRAQLAAVVLASVVVHALVLGWLGHYLRTPVAASPTVTLLSATVMPATAAAPLAAPRPTAGPSVQPARTPLPLGKAAQPALRQALTTAVTSPVAAPVLPPTAPPAALAVGSQAAAEPARSQAGAGLASANPAASPLATAVEASSPVGPSTSAGRAQSAGAQAGAQAGSTAAAGGPPSVAPALELPSRSADYLNNPPPEYPRISRQRGEQGRVLVRALIGVDGVAQKVELGQSSGYDRLDHAALAAVARWRFVPGKRHGMPQSMWFGVPVSFCLAADGVQCQP